MSFLAPLYLLGGLAVSLPLLLHLIRRTPQGRQPFSSLMFLSPTPPRITRRSRIEHWLLLALRVAAIALLAMIFARPFLRSTVTLLMDNRPGRRVAILLDASASMRRGDLWRQAIARAEQMLDQLGPNDTAALFRFDGELRTIVDFPDPTVTHAAQRSLLRQGLKEQSPSWRATDLGRALANVADSLAADQRDRGEDHPRQIVLISDLQQGADISALQGYEWPRLVKLTVETVKFNASQPDGGALHANNNAAVRLLTNAKASEPRALVSNCGSSRSEEFQIGWLSASGELLADTSVYVPSGQSRVAKLADRPTGADRLRLTGDSQEFDNDFYVSPLVQRQLSVIYLGDDSADDPRGLRFFLARVWPETSGRRVAIADVRSNESLQIVPGQRPHLIVTTTALSGTHSESLRKYLQAGGVALVLAAAESPSTSIAGFLPGIEPANLPEQTATTQPVAPQEVRGNSAGIKNRASFALLTDIDFTHPVFGSFADPRFGDFTKVRFWKHQRWQLSETAKARVIAKFDDGAPALWEQPVGSGRAFVFASSWRPTDSQLALSSKFVPLLSNLLAQASGLDGAALTSLEVGESLPISAPADEAVIVTTPSGAEVRFPVGSQRLLVSDQPGNYLVKHSQSTETIAVNLASAESDTALMPVDRLEQLGVRVGGGKSLADQADRERQMRDIELESRQKLWQWLLVAVIGLLGIETAVAARASKRQMQAAHAA